MTLSKGTLGTVVQGRDEIKMCVKLGTQLPFCLYLSLYGFATSLMAKIQPLLCTGYSQESPL